ncbi:MAG: hypothetical protein NT015_15205 [Alphaproteobacteria bacterium]|nr:hypothetical protein [Alphaproteobacteria bacterium]
MPQERTNLWTGRTSKVTECTKPELGAQSATAPTDHICKGREIAEGGR